MITLSKELLYVILSIILYNINDLIKEHFFKTKKQIIIYYIILIIIKIYLFYYNNLL